MTSPANQTISRAERDMLPELRAEISEAMASAIVYMGLAQGFVDRGDDGGCAYALRKSVGYFRYGIGTFNQLADIRKRIELAGGQQ